MKNFKLIILLLGLSLIGSVAAMDVDINAEHLDGPSISGDHNPDDGYGEDGLDGDDDRNSDLYGHTDPSNPTSPILSDGGFFDGDTGPADPSDLENFADTGASSIGAGNSSGVTTEAMDDNFKRGLGGSEEDDGWDWDNAVSRSFVRDKHGRLTRIDIEVPTVDSSEKDQDGNSDGYGVITPFSDGDSVDSNGYMAVNPDAANARGQGAINNGSYTPIEAGSGPADGDGYMPVDPDAANARGQGAINNGSYTPVEPGSGPAADNGSDVANDADGGYMDVTGFDGSRSDADGNQTGKQLSDAPNQDSDGVNAGTGGYMDVNPDADNAGPGGSTDVAPDEDGNQEWNSANTEDLLNQVQGKIYGNRIDSVKDVAGTKQLISDLQDELGKMPEAGDRDTDGLRNQVENAIESLQGSLDTARVYDPTSNYSDREWNPANAQPAGDFGRTLNPTYGEDPPTDGDVQNLNEDPSQADVQSKQVDQQLKDLLRQGVVDRRGAVDTFEKLLKDDSLTPDQRQRVEKLSADYEEYLKNRKKFSWFRKELTNNLFDMTHRSFKQREGQSISSARRAADNGEPRMHRNQALNNMINARSEHEINSHIATLEDPNISRTEREAAYKSANDAVNNMRGGNSVQLGSDIEDAYEPDEPDEPQSQAFSFDDGDDL